jgi:aryl-alcohol dehydrogenase-like predicted oxidoreductase
MKRSLDDYVLLGRSGLRVSPLALGGASFGTEWGYGADADEARSIMALYADNGGNFIDTANVYTNGTSEKLIGDFTFGQRDKFVIATKYSGGLDPTDANSHGNHRKNMVRSVEHSLMRLRTDYIDLLYLHAWDDRSLPDEVMRGFDDLIKSGKVLYAGISDTPAWQIARMQTLADLRGWAPLVALQIEYSLIRRDGERELLPMARELGLGVTAWWALAGGLLTGKYSTATNLAAAGASKRQAGVMTAALNEKNLRIASAVSSVGGELGRPPALVALAWVLHNPAVTAPLIGVRSASQLQTNLGCLEVELDASQIEMLEKATEFEPGFPHDMLASPATQSMFTGPKRVEERRSRV